ncbi:MAG: hypothetical protein J6Q94_07305 [Clostridia bacterium]|nr:hypothetical protein [Clostridia bacterium]
MKKKILVIVSVIVCVVAIGVFILAGKNISPSVGQYLRADNSDMIILDNSPIVMSTRNDNMFEKHENGDKILVFHDGINESYPGSTGVYLSVKLADGHISDISETVLRQLYEMGWISSEDLLVSENEYPSALFDIKHAWSHSTFDTEKIKIAADNAEMLNGEYNYHFPVFKFDTYESFRDFLDNYDKNFDAGYSDAEDFREKLKDINEEYFNENAVIIISYYTGSGNTSYNVDSVYSDGEIFRLNIAKHSEGQGGTSVITSCLCAVGVEKTFLGDCNSFDAVLVE